MYQILHDNKCPTQKKAKKTAFEPTNHRKRMKTSETRYPLRNSGPTIQTIELGITIL